MRGWGEANLDVHEVVCADASKLRELLSALFQKLGNCVTLLALDTRVRLHFSGCQMAAHRDTLPMTTSVPIGIGDLNIFILELLLFLQPLLAQLFTFLPLYVLSFSIRQERSVDSGVLPQLGFLRRLTVFVCP